MRFEVPEDELVNRILILSFIMIHFLHLALHTEESLSNPQFLANMMILRACWRS